MAPDWRVGHAIALSQPGRATAHRAMRRFQGTLFVIQTVELPPRSGRNPDAEELLAVGLQRQQAFRHPNIVRILDFYVRPQVLQVHLEYPAHGSVRDLLDEFGPMSDRRLASTVTDILAGLNYLHLQEPPVAHRCLCAANLHVGSHANVKLANIGYGSLAPAGRGDDLATYLPWLAPEVVREEVEDWTKADLWSVGCTVIELATGEAPWGEHTALDGVLQALCGDGVCKTPPLPPVLAPWAASLVAADACREAAAARAPAATMLERLCAAL